jgi:hypothetical protein
MFTAFGAILGLVLAAGSVRATTSNKLMYVTFSGPVSLPGVTLGTGTYTFEVVDSDVTLDLVRVRNKDRSRVYFTGFTNRIDRPAGSRATTPVVFGESRPGTPPPIAAWYHDDRIGHEFIYPKKAR